MAPSRFAGISAGPAESARASMTSDAYLGEVGERVTVTARVAGVTPDHGAGSGPALRHNFLRTVDSGLAVSILLPESQSLRLGAVVRAEGIVTGQRTQGSNCVTDITADRIEEIG